MSDHEFEKQVQRKMDELRIRPSDAVWTEVQKNIRQNKPRHRFGFWLPAFFVFLATTGYILYTYNQSPTLPIAQSEQVAQINTTSSANNNLHSDNNSTQTTNNAPVQKAQDKYKEEQPNSVTVPNNNAPQNSVPLQNNNTAQQNSAPLHNNAAQQNSAPSHNNKAAQQNSAPVYNNNTAQQNSAPVHKNDKAVERNNTPLHNNPNQQANSTSLHKNNQLSEAALSHTKRSTRPHNNTKITTPQNNRQPSLSNSQTNKPDNRHPIATNNTTEEPGHTLPTSIPAIAPGENTPITTSKAAPNTLKIFAPEKQNSTATATMPVQPIQKQKGPKWQWGLLASAGYSRISQTNLFNLNGLLGSPEKNRAEDLAMRSPASPAYQQSTYISVAPPVEKKAASIQADLAYAAGAFVQRPLSKRLRLTIGLQYSYMSAHTTIGKLVEKSTNVNYGAAMQRVVPSYYTVAETKDALQQSQLNQSYTPPVDSAVSQKYTYRFHAIELPVMINWQINKGRKLPPFVLDAGFSLSHMWSIDALHFDGIQGIYYKNDDLFNKTQLNTIMGLNVGLFQQSKLPIWIGPSLRYSLTGLLKKEVSKGQFLWSTGISLRVGLNRL